MDAKGFFWTTALAGVCDIASNAMPASLSRQRCRCTQYPIAMLVRRASRHGRLSGRPQGRLLIGADRELMKKRLLTICPLWSVAIADDAVYTKAGKTLLSVHVRGRNVVRPRRNGFV